MVELDGFEIVFNVFLILVGLSAVVWVFVEHFKYEEKQQRKLLEETNHIEAENLSKKLRSSRVEMGLRKPKTFSTKRKPQKKG